MTNEKLNTPPTRAERKAANEGLSRLIDVIDELNHPENLPQIHLQETSEPIKIPLRALKLLAEILKHFRDGNAVSIVPVGTSFTTQKAAEFLNCSRPHIIKLIDQGELPASKVGRHRRIAFKDLTDYKQKMLKERKKELMELMKDAEDLNLYEADQ